jgi:metallophosphoesterase (TIGR00282 family)
VNLLFIGDVIGNPGRKAVAAVLPALRAERKIEFVLANVENLAAGFGVSEGALNELKAAGVDAFSSGNHIWDKKEVEPCWPIFPTLIRPANYPPQTPGRGACLFTTPSGVPIGVLNLLGRVFIDIALDDPFRRAKEEVAALKAQGARIVVLDFHAEATSEKIAMARHLDGEISVQVGTHTHVPTADARVSAKGSAMITDLGLTGGYSGIIGMKPESILRKFLTGLKGRYEVAEDQVEFWALLAEVDEKTGKAVSVEQIHRTL